MLILTLGCDDLIALETRFEFLTVIPARTYTPICVWPLFGQETLHLLSETVFPVHCLFFLRRPGWRRHFMGDFTLRGRSVTDFLHLS